MHTLVPQEARVVQIYTFICERAAAACCNGWVDVYVCVCVRETGTEKERQRE